MGDDEFHQKSTALAREVARERARAVKALRTARRTPVDAEWDESGWIKGDFPGPAPPIGLAHPSATRVPSVRLAVFDAVLFYLYEKGPSVIGKDFRRALGIPDTINVKEASRTLWRKGYLARKWHPRTHKVRNQIIRPRQYKYRLTAKGLTRLKERLAQSRLFFGDDDQW